jgi:ssRNA-specific RNase YbeY (16S rRNA maturation enzyme)
MLTEIEKSKENHKKGDKKKAYEVISSLSRPQSRQNKSKVEVVVHDKKKAEEIKKDLRYKSKPRQKSKI